MWVFSIYFCMVCEHRTSGSHWSITSMLSFEIVCAKLQIWPRIRCACPGRCTFPASWFKRLYDLGGISLSKSSTSGKPPYVHWWWLTHYLSLLEALTSDEYLSKCFQDYSLYPWTFINTLGHYILDFCFLPGHFVSVYWHFFHIPIIYCGIITLLSYFCHHYSSISIKDIYVYMHCIVYLYVTRVISTLG